MKIANYSVAMASVRVQEISYTKNESLVKWRDDRPDRESQPHGSASILDYLKKNLQDTLELSAQAKELLKRQQSNRANNVGAYDDLMPISDTDDQKIMLLEKLLSAISGREIKLHIPRFKNMHAPSNLQIPGLNENFSPKANEAAEQPRQGWGLVYQRQESYQESESLSFAAKGIVKTADGKEIHLDVQMNMSRQFAASSNLTLKGGDALLDPLVINFKGNAAQLTDTKYSFDLDADGESDQISFLKEGSGFLALDANNDGVINNGKELFGPSTGAGFQELAAYDADHNGWIDENDPIFDKLRIWTKDETGKDQLFALGQKGVGAVFLANINAGFNMKDSENETLGVARKAGVFLRENGSAGTMQQIDLMA